MKVSGLFAGIGGIELGFAAAGLETILLCENWLPAAAVLDRNFPSIPRHGDVADLKFLPDDTEVLTAGFPCQDLSQAGKTLGIAGAQSGLVSHVFRLIDFKSVPIVVIENVPFMLKLDRGKAMRVLVEAFEERGYRWAYRIINSLAFVPQRRERVIFVATNNDLDPSDVLFADDENAIPTNEGLNTCAHGFYWTEGTRGLGWAVDSIPPLKKGSTIGIPSPPAILMPNGNVVKPDLRDAERLQGFPVNWTAAAAEVAPNSIRWSLVGNAVTVPVAKWLGSRLLQPADRAPILEAPLITGNGWPRAARGTAGNRVEVRIGSLPKSDRAGSLEDFLLYPGDPLSARATKGFLSRARKGNLRFRPGFLNQLDRHLCRQESLGLTAV